MDSDCLIKITKSGIKEQITRCCEVLIPLTVQSEVVDAGIAKGLPDAEATRENISSGKLKLFGTDVPHENGDASLIRLYPSSRCAAVATDDIRLVKRLKAHGIPFITPGLIIFKLAASGAMDRHQAIGALERLSEFISPDEYATVLLLLEKSK